MSSSTLTWDLATNGAQPEDYAFKSVRPSSNYTSARTVDGLAITNHNTTVYTDLKGFHERNGAYSITITLKDNTAADKAANFMTLGYYMRGRGSGAITVGRAAGSDDLTIGMVGDGESSRANVRTSVSCRNTFQTVSLVYNPAAIGDSRLGLYTDAGVLIADASGLPHRNFSIPDPKLFLGTSAWVSEVSWDGKFDVANCVIKSVKFTTKSPGVDPEVLKGSLGTPTLIVDSNNSVIVTGDQITVKFTLGDGLVASRDFISVFLADADGNLYEQFSYSDGDGSTAAAWQYTVTVGNGGAGSVPQGILRYVIAVYSASASFEDTTRAILRGVPSSVEYNIVNPDTTPNMSFQILSVTDPILALLPSASQVDGYTAQIAIKLSGSTVETLTTTTFSVITDGSATSGSIVDSNGSPLSLSLFSTILQPGTLYTVEGSVSSLVGTAIATQQPSSGARFLRTDDATQPYFASPITAINASNSTAGIEVGFIGGDIHSEFDVYMAVFETNPIGGSIGFTDANGVVDFIVGDASANTIVTSKSAPTGAHNTAKSFYTALTSSADPNAVVNIVPRAGNAPYYVYVVIKDYPVDASGNPYGYNNIVSDVKQFQITPNMSSIALVPTYTGTNTGNMVTTGDSLTLSWNTQYAVRDNTEFDQLFAGSTFLGQNITAANFALNISNNTTFSITQDISGSAFPSTDGYADFSLVYAGLAAKTDQTETGVSKFYVDRALPVVSASVLTQGTTSLVVQFSMSDAAHTAISNDSGMSITLNAVTTGNDADGDASGSIPIETGFSVTFKDADANVTDWQFTMTGLRQFTQYEIKASYTDRVGNAVTDEVLVPKTFTTDGTAPIVSSINAVFEPSEDGNKALRLRVTADAIDSFTDYDMHVGVLKANLSGDWGFNATTGEIDSVGLGFLSTWADTRVADASGNKDVSKNVNLVFTEAMEALNDMGTTTPIATAVGYRAFVYVRDSNGNHVAHLAGSPVVFELSQSLDISGGVAELVSNNSNGGFVTDGNTLTLSWETNYHVDPSVFTVTVGSASPTAIVGDASGAYKAVIAGVTGTDVTDGAYVTYAIVNANGDNVASTPSGILADFTDPAIEFMINTITGTAISLDVSANDVPSPYDIEGYTLDISLNYMSNPVPPIVNLYYNNLVLKANGQILNKSTVSPFVDYSVMYYSPISKLVVNGIPSAPLVILTDTSYNFVYADQAARDADMIEFYFNGSLMSGATTPSIVIDDSTVLNTRTIRFPDPIGSYTAGTLTYGKAGVAESIAGISIAAPGTERTLTPVFYGLEDHSTYGINAVLTDPAGRSVTVNTVSNNATFTTPDVTPPTLVANSVTVTSLLTGFDVELQAFDERESSSFSVYAEVSTDLGFDPVFDAGFVVRATSTNTSLAQATANPITFSIDSLTSATTYKMKIFLVDASGNVTSELLLDDLVTDEEPSAPADIGQFNNTGALELDGTDQYVSTDLSGATATDGYTQSIWFSPNEFPEPPETMTLMASANGPDDTNYPQTRLYLETIDVGTLVIKYDIIPGPPDDPTTVLQSTTSLVLGESHHVVVSSDPSGNHYMYLDGELEDTVTDAVVGLSLDTSPLTVVVGSSIPAPSDNFAGVVDQVSVLDDAVTDVSELSSTFYADGETYSSGPGDLNANLDVSGTEPLMWLEMDDTAGTSPVNSSERVGVESTSILANTTFSLSSTAPVATVTGNAGVAGGFVNRRSLMLDGTNYVVIPSSAYLMDKSFTFSAWIRFTEDTGTTDICLLDNKQTSTTQRAIFVRTNNFDSGAYNAVKVRYGSSNIVSNKVVFQVGEWYHLVVVFKSDTTVSIYVNNFDAGSTGTSTAAIPLATSVNIGADSVGANKFIGLIEDIAIFNTELTSADVSEMNAGGYPTDLADHSKASNVVEYWRLEGDLRSAAIGGADLSMSSGTARFTLDVPLYDNRKSLYLNGTNDFMYTTSTYTFTDSIAHTVSLWLNCSNISTDGNDFKSLFMIESSISTINGYNMLLRMYNGYVYLGGHGPAVNLNRFTNTRLENNTWYHIAYTLSSNEIVSFYVNGVLDKSYSWDGDSKTEGGALTVGATKIFAIGLPWTDNGGSIVNQYFKGFIDDACVFSTALTATEVNLLYNNGVPDTIAYHPAFGSCQGWWRMENISADNKVADESGHARHMITQQNTMMLSTVTPSLEYVDRGSMVLSSGALTNSAYPSTIYDGDMTYSAWIKTAATSGSIIGGSVPMRLYNDTNPFMYVGAITTLTANAAYNPNNSVSYNSHTKLGVNSDGKYISLAPGYVLYNPNGPGSTSWSIAALPTTNIGTVFNTTMISADASVVVQSGNTGINIYTRDGTTNTWTLRENISHTSGDYPGISVSGDGTYIAVGVHTTGIVYCYKRSSPGSYDWSLNRSTVDTIGTSFGYSAVSISDDGQHLAVGMYQTNTTRVYNNDGTNNWTLNTTITDVYSHSLMMSGDGTTLVIGDSTGGYVYKRYGISWYFSYMIPALEQHYIAINYDGSIITGRNQSNNQNLIVYNYGRTILTTTSAAGEGGGVGISGDGTLVIHHTGGTTLNAFDITIDSLYTSTTTTVINDNNWHHVAATKSGSDVKLYIDGKEDVSYSYTFGTASNGISIGSINGNVSDIAVFTTALSATDVYNIWNGGAPGDLSVYGSSLAAWYKMDTLVGTGTSRATAKVPDESGNGYDLSVFGTPYVVPDVPERSVPIVSSKSLSLPASAEDYASHAFSSPVPAFMNTTSSAFAVSMWYKSDVITGTLFGGSNSLSNSGTAYLWVGSSFAGSGGLTRAWTHVVLSSDGTNASLYINGVLKGTVASTAVMGGTTIKLGVGFTGSMDDVSVFDTSLDSEEVLALFGGGVPADVSRLLKYSAYCQAWWRFENLRADGKVVDWTGRGRDLTLNGAAALGVSVPMSGSSKCVRIDRDDQGFTATTIANFGGNTPWSLSAWVNVDDITSEHMFITWSQLRVSFTNGRFAIQNNSLAGSILMGANVWNHVVLTYDPVAKFSIYTNGVLDVTGVGIGWTGSAGTIEIGRSTDTGVAEMGLLRPGYIDDISFYTSVLTDAEANALYNGVDPRSVPSARSGNLVAYWRFEEYVGASVNEIADESGNGNKLTNAYATIPSLVDV